METTFTKTKRTMSTREAFSTLTGFIVGLAKLIVTNEAIGAVLLAFVTGAAAWLGQTIAKLLWANVKKHLPTFYSYLKSKFMSSQVIDRLKSPTPPFFKKLRNIGLILATIGGCIAAAPIALPAALVTAGGYALFVGSTISAVSQLTKDDVAIKTNVTEELLKIKKLFEEGLLTKEEYEEQKKKLLENQ